MKHHKTVNLKQRLYRRTCLLAGLALGSLATIVQAGSSLLLKQGDRIAIIGDSITEQKQYSVMIEAYLRMAAPELDLKLIQLGWSGERAPGFAMRMENDLMSWQPTVATICYGMNDGNYRPYNEAIGAAYRKGMSAIVERCAQAGMRVVVGTPGVVDSNTWRKNDPEATAAYNENLATLGEIGRELAGEHGFAVGEVHQSMLAAMVAAKEKLGAEYHVAGNDGVHPAANGHLCMAYAFLKGMGLDGNIGELAVAWPDKITASAGHQAEAVAEQAGSFTINSSRYPFCFTGNETHPGGTVSILPFLPFNDDLNRFMLVVKGLPTEEAEVKWGAGKKRFTRAELEAGINLAAHFLKNPFSEPFKRVFDGVAAKQRRETEIVKGSLTHLRKFEKLLEDDAESAKFVAAVRAKLLAQLDEPQASVQALVEPVEHRLEIHPCEAVE